MAHSLTLRLTIGPWIIQANGSGRATREDSAGGDVLEPKPFSHAADNVSARTNCLDDPKEPSPMSGAIQQAKEQHFANLNALRRQLEEMVVNTKRPGSTEQEQRSEVTEPVLVIRGK